MKVRFMDDYTLVQKCRRGDTGAYGILVDRLRGKITAHVLCKVSLQDTPDVVQEVFVAIVSCINKNQYLGRSKLETYVNRITSNKVTDYHRGYERMKELLSASDILPERSVDPWEAINNNILLQQLSLDLSENHKEVFQLKLAGLGYGEISEELDFTYEAARGRYQRCLGKIRESVSTE